jgi:hypothetical protein
VYRGRPDIAAPPSSPRPQDPVERDDPEALIEEARQRARRRRRLYGAAAAGLALLGVSLFVIFGRPDPSQSASPEPPAQPIVADSEDAATLVAHFGEFHVGWVAVYADGRVIIGERTTELRAVNSLDSVERRLTADGLERVRSGEIEPRAFLEESVIKGSISNLPAGTWADPEFKDYEPTRYGMFWFGEKGPGNGPFDATKALSRLPAPVQALLRGKERTYKRVVFPLGPSGVEYFEVSAGRAKLVWRSGDFFQPSPVLPHGEPIYFPG